MSPRKLTALLAVLVIAGSWLGAMLVVRGPSPPLEYRLHREVGRTLAREAIKLLGPGGRLSVVTRDTAEFPQPSLDLVLAAFEREARRAGAAIESVKGLQVDPLRPVQVPAGDFFERIRQAAPGDVVVSFMGPPVLSDEQRAALGVIKPKIVAFCPSPRERTDDLRTLASQGLLHAAVVNRPDPATVRMTSAGHETFAQRYVRATATELLEARPLPVSR